MEETRIYLIAQFDEASSKKLARIYDRLTEAGLVGEQTKNVPYHITLGSFDVSEQSQVTERAQDICRKTNAFEINLSNIAMFGLKVLFIAPAINTELLELYSGLRPNEPISGYHNWVAHATILIDNPRNIETAIPIVAESFTPFAATIEKIGVLAFPPAKLIAQFELST